MAVDLGVDHGAVDGRVHEALYGQGLGGQYPWPFNLEEQGLFTKMKERYKSRVGLINYN